MPSDELKRLKHRQAGFQAALTKGLEERRRAAKMAAWTRKHGKDDARNPFSKQNYVPSAFLGTPGVPIRGLSIQTETLPTPKLA
jgi:hypothetical protein